MKKTELLNRIATLLGGRAAEELIFGDISTGAHNDLAKATDIARSMVKEYGMSAKVGQVYFATEKQSRFLNLPGHQAALEYSDATAEIIDHEVREIIKQQYETAQNILEAKKSLLKKSAELLLEKETIEGQTLERMMAEDQPVEA
jgi:cell division protease FtsH